MTRHDEPSATADEHFFDPSFLAELEELATGAGAALEPHPLSVLLERKLEQFLHDPGPEPLGEEHFADLDRPAMSERTNALIEICRESPRRNAVMAVESFVVFFQALDPTLQEDGARAIRRLFFRLVPTLLQIAWHDFSDSIDVRADGVRAIRSLERVLLEIASVRLTPDESELIFRSIDQMTAFIAVGEYHLATELVSSQLLSIIERNRLARALYRLMEVEVDVQRYLKDRLGYSTPQIRLPDDVEALGHYGPLRILHESGAAAEHRFIQVQLPDMAILSDVVLHFVSQESGEGHDLRLDALGSAELRLADGSYDLGLLYQPPAELTA